MSPENEKYLLKLKKAKLSNTAPRKAIFEALSKSGHKPLTMQELVNLCSHKADRASIYRGVEALENINVINKIHTGWKYKLELSDEFHGHHHHLICTNCHSVTIALQNPEIEKAIMTTGEKSDFKIKSHSLEMYGLCKKCSKIH